MTNETTTKRITDFRVTWTADHEQYFQGHGIANTSYTHTATGCGETLRKAFDDCLDQLVCGLEIETGIDELEPAMLAELTSQVKEHEMIYWDITQTKCRYKGSHIIACTECFGTGEVFHEPVNLTCDVCNGTGKEVDENPDCAVCAGKWHYYVNVDVKVEGQ